MWPLCVSYSSLCLFTFPVCCSSFHTVHCTKIFLTHSIRSPSGTWHPAITERMAPGNVAHLPETTGEQLQWRLVYMKTETAAQMPDLTRYSRYHFRTNGTQDLPQHTDLTAFRGLQAPVCLTLHVARYVQSWYRVHKDWELVCQLDESPRRMWVGYGYCWEIAVLLCRPRAKQHAAKNGSPPPYVVGISREGRVDQSFEGLVRHFAKSVSW